jgi:hypothetical protein
MRTVSKLLMLALAAAVVPACGSGNEKKNPPVLMDARPFFDAAGVPHFPVMILEFDRALDPATVIQNNIDIFLTDVSGAPTVPWGGGSISLIYIPGTFQVVIVNNAFFTASTEYAVVVFPGLTSSEGIPIQAFATGSIANRFVIGNSGNTTRPTFAVPVQAVGGGQGEIFWTASQATEGGPITATYEIYQSSTSGGQDLLGTNTVVTPFPNFTTTGLTPGAQYFFRMIVRDTAGNILLTPEFTGTAKP